MSKDDRNTLDKDEIWKDFQSAVNMAPSQLEKWLETDESKKVGYSENGGESVGHHSGRRIVAIKHKGRSDLTDDDYTHMKKVIGYVHRHLAQGGPGKDKHHSAWRYSLMNWGHDPMKA